MRVSVHTYVVPLCVYELSGAGLSSVTVPSFLSAQVLGVLSQDGIMRFVNIQTCKLLFEIGSVEEGISSSVISPHGRYIASIMENGSLNVYSVQALTQEINKVCHPGTESVPCTAVLHHQEGNVLLSCFLTSLGHISFSGCILQLWFLTRLLLSLVLTPSLPPLISFPEEVFNPESWLQTLECCGPFCSLLIQSLLRHSIS